MFDEDAVDVVYDVVINDEGQYSIWPIDHPMPLGWTAVGKRGVRADCLAYVDEVWTDMRPLSLQRRMAEAQAPTPPLDQ